MSDSPPAAILVTGDLMFASKAAAAAARTGIPLETALGVDALWAKLANGLPPLVMLDLSAPNLNIRDVVERLRKLGSSTNIVAFGPHLQEELLEAATVAGCDVVMSRGQFNARVDALLRQYAAG